MTNIIPYLKDAAFEDSVIDILSHAFDMGCMAIHDACAALDRENLAAHVVQSALLGERDPERLCAAALSAMGPQPPIEAVVHADLRSRLKHF